MSRGTRIFLIGLTAFVVLVCFYCLSFTFKVNSIEKEAADLAEKKITLQDPVKRHPGNQLLQFLYEDSVRQERVAYKNRYLDSIQGEKVYLWNTFKQSKEQQLNLGLDLQGGMSVVLQVSLKELLISMSDGSRDPNFLKALDVAEQKMTTSQDDYISLFYKSFQEINPNGKLAPIFRTRNYSDKINFNTSDNDVLKIIREEAASAITRTNSIITSRIDQFGTKQPIVTLDPNKARITVEIAGVDDPARVRRLLQATANLEFWETYKANEIGKSINDANDALKVHMGNLKDKSPDSSETNTLSSLEKTASADKTKTDTAGKTASDLLGNLSDKKSTDTSQAAQMEKFKNENPLFTILQPSIDNDRRYVESPVIGLVKAIDTGTVREYFSYPDVADVFPKDVEFMFGAKPYEVDKSVKSKIFALYAIKKASNSDDAPLDGSVITQARKDIDQNGNVVVNMQMNPDGAHSWKELTKKNINNYIAIVLDKQVYSAPVVNNEIDGGNSQISGGFDQQEADDLANVLKTGKLPASARIIEEELVGPSLGKQSINAGFVSMAASLVLIFVFMTFFYSSGGVIAWFVMLLNLFMIIGLLAGFGSTLTLPGIAGLVLTLGMAVDANVIIYERIKEELRAGKATSLAVSEGFKHSYSAIIDGNVTTLLTGLILLVTGIGPIRGFAVTLCIGILTTLYTAVLISKVIVDWKTEKGGNFSFYTSYTKNFLQNINIDFIGRRKITYAISSVVIIAGIVSMFTRGFDLGIDFKGGREYRVRFEKAVNTSDVRDELSKRLDPSVVVKQFGAANQVKITTGFMIDKTDKSTDSTVEYAVYNGLLKYIGNESFESFKTANLLSSTKVDPTVSVDFRNSSIKASILALIVIFLYILIRFRKYGYSVGAVAATMHDALLVVCVFSLFHGILPFPLEVDQTFIAAILTIIGYSVNDTVIIFDRLREYLKDRPNADMKETMNAAINSTLSRTFNTAFTVFIVVFILFLFGGSVLKAFSFAMLLGVVIGCYSSVFIASPIMYDLDPEHKKRDIKPSSSLKK